MTTTIKLSKAYPRGSDETFSEIVLREPIWSDFISLGFIMEEQPIGPDGSAVVITDYDKIEAYASRLVRSPVTAADLPQMNLTDTLAVRDAVLDFFRQAMRSRSSPTSPSGGSDGDPATSAG